MNTWTYQCAPACQPPGEVVSYHAAGALPPWGPASTLGQPPGFFWDRDRSHARVEHFADGPEARRMLERIEPGDHVVFPSIAHGFGDTNEWRRMMRVWLNLGVKVHFVEQGLVIDRKTEWLLGPVFDAYWRIFRAIYLAAKTRPKEPCSQRKHQERVRRGGAWEEVFARYAVPLRADPAAPSGQVHVYAMQVEAPDVEGARRWREIRYLHTLRRFADRPEGGRLLKRVKPGDEVRIVSGQGFTAVEDVVVTAGQLLALGATLTLTDFGISTATKPGRDLLACFGALEHLRRAILGGRTALFQKWKPSKETELPFYIKKVPHGKTLYADAFRIGLLEKIHALRGKKTKVQLLEWLEEQEAAHFDDRKLPDHTISRWARRNWHPDHGVLYWDSKWDCYKRRRFWTMRMLLRVRKPGFLDEVRRRLEERGIPYPDTSNVKPRKRKSRPAA